MRRFYVRASFRRRGVAAALARALIARASRATRVITPNAPPEAAAFWQSLGFATDRRDGHTHVMRLS
jgi:GNAT superfamily N-acetyltransferase